jgi:hypothetical protein
VAWRHGLELFNSLKGNDISFTLIKGGDHRLSSPRDLRTIVDAIETLSRERNRGHEAPRDRSDTKDGSSVPP